MTALITYPAWFLHLWRTVDGFVDDDAADTWAPEPFLGHQLPHPEWARIADPMREALIANRIRGLVGRVLHANRTRR